MDEEDVVILYICVCVYICNGILLIHNKELNLAIFDNVNGSRGQYAKWNVRERQMLYDFTYMWNLKNKWTNVK